MEHAIEVQGLTKTFGDFTAVDNLSFRIKPGEIFGFLGPNGSGKSTTIRMLCGILSPSGGQGKVLGYDLKDSEKIKQNIGYMSQKFSLYEDLTVEENIDFYAGIYGLRGKEVRERKEELIQLALLTGKEKALAGTLSGGWKQRLALACALVHRPHLLFLDEPTAGVDPVSRRVFWELLYRVAAQGVTILVTTHYMDEAEKCDVVGFIYQGKLMGFGTPGELMGAMGLTNLEDVFIKVVEEDYQDEAWQELLKSHRKEVTGE
ncbi:MAG: ABC transporter ATP-binding protein [Clostridia bacterium]|nr:ABC transporter ATP-binding protein [Clostridia bacterium]